MSHYLSPQQLEAWCNNYLLANEFKDYCPNGLQVDAAVTIKKIVTGVTASEALIDKAIQKNADAILVHHGYFWKGEAQCIVGIKGKRIRKLLQNKVSLIAYHLPLDAHPKIGNNAQLANLLQFKNSEALYPQEKHSIGNIYSAQNLSITTLINKITTALNREPLHIAAGNDRFNRIAICTGAAQDMIEQAAQMGCDAFISGEISERTTHLARELGVDYFACGHHATEKGGIKALGELINKQLEIDVEFVDVTNPV